MYKANKRIITSTLSLNTISYNFYPITTVIMYFIGVFAICLYIDTKINLKHINPLGSQTMVEMCLVLSNKNVIL